MSDFNLSEAQKIVIELQIARKQLLEANETVNHTLSLVQRQTHKLEVLVNTVRLIDPIVLTNKIQKMEEAQKANSKSTAVFILKILFFLALSSSIFYYFYTKS
ncbi:MAG: hypothetical protein RQ763_08050 [Sulfurimonas sp.]|uniref:hypothetical protein n=1 Tax=Sulfurimonas sp. TaxID=2022749 RepID=UPI0028CE670D|nr:hypothetical protein [Sulfurimonas sp.]MDT8339137.1 hypothetical protein [Sulfurimonas sp.]